MTTDRERRYVLAGVLVLALAVAAVLLGAVAGTVFLAVTVAYVLVPVRDALLDRGLGRRVASGVATALAFVAAVALAAPLVALLYRYRTDLLDLLRSLPDRLTLTVGEFTFAVEVASVAPAVREALATVAVRTARAAPVLALKVVLFAFVVYALLLRPDDVKAAVFGLVPADYHDVVLALHRRVRATLFAIYVLQAATAVGTFLVALVVFWALGYEAAFAFAVVCAVLQFIPIVGPSILVVAVAASDVLAGMPARGVTVLALGLLLIGVLPDAVVRTKLAEYAANLPASVYFVGFTGGVLSVGAIGIIAGPLVVALVVELVELLSGQPSTG